MSYKYYNPSISYYSKSSSENLREGFQAFVDSEWYNSTSASVVQEETPFGSNIYEDIDARINIGINVLTGEKLGDDYKTLLFKDIEHSTVLGTKFYFDDNYWIVVNTEITKNLVAGCLVRRCNNVLRWYDENGSYFQEPCCIDYKIARARDQFSNENPVVPQGFMDVYAQLNDNTKKIDANHRFLFGNSSNRVAFKVFGNGVRNFINQKTYDDNSASILILTMGGSFVDPYIDDIQNGIANAFKYVYHLEIIPNSISIEPSETIQLVPRITLNEQIVSKDVTYQSSKPNIATVSATGLVTGMVSGSAIITCTMDENSLVYDTAQVVVSASATDIYEIIVTPNPSYLLKGTSETYQCYLYKNGIAQSNIFTFEINDSNVPVDKYTFTRLTDNSFLVQNIDMYLSYPLSIKCKSDIYEKIVEIHLRGNW